MIERRITAVLLILLATACMHSINPKSKVTGEEPPQKPADIPLIDKPIPVGVYKTVSGTGTKYCELAPELFATVIDGPGSRESDKNIAQKEQQLSQAVCSEQNFQGHTIVKNIVEKLITDTEAIDLLIFNAQRIAQTSRQTRINLKLQAIMLQFDRDKDLLISSAIQEYFQGALNEQEYSNLRIAYSQYAEALHDWYRNKSN